MIVIVIQSPLGFLISARIAASIAAVLSFNVSDIGLNLSNLDLSFLGVSSLLSVGVLILSLNLGSLALLWSGLLLWGSLLGVSALLAFSIVGLSLDSDRLLLW